MKGAADLPPPLVARIASYNVETTLDVANLRRVNKSFGRMIKSQLVSSGAAAAHHRGISYCHSIECPGRREQSKSYVHALVNSDALDDFESAGFCLGDVFDGRGFQQKIVSGDGVRLERFVALGSWGGTAEECAEVYKKGLNDDAADAGAAAIRADETSPDAGDNDDAKGAAALAKKILNAIESMEGSKSVGGLRTFIESAKRAKLFDPVQRLTGAPGPCSEMEPGEELIGVSMIATFDIPEGAACIRSVGEGYLEIQTFDKFISYEGNDEGFLLFPAHPKSVFVAPIVEETRDSTNGTKRYRIKVLLESMSLEDSLRDAMWDAEPERSMAFDVLKDEHQNRIGPVEGVVLVDDAIGDDLARRLSSDVDALASSQESRGAVDYHPNSNDVVRDLVHPGLYSYVKGVSDLRASVEEVDPCILLPRRRSTIDAATGDGSEDDERNATMEPGKDFWGRTHEDSKYQWLPTYFDISSDGQCTIEHYINNLTPRTDPVHSNLHDSLARLFEQCLPYVESVYSYVRAIRPHLRNDEDELDWDDGDLAVIPMVPYSLKGNKLQVITKIVDYELKPGQSHEGVWHVEGMSHEEIVLTALYVLDRDECISGGDIMYKRAFLKDEAEYIFSSVPQERPNALNEAVDEGLCPLGKVETKKGRLIVFPNSHVHKVTEMINEGAGDSGEGVAPKNKRRIVVFFLVNPLRRIVSTRELPPQRGGSMAHEDALQHRLELMKERKFHKEDWNVREIEKMRALIKVNFPWSVKA